VRVHFREPFQFRERLFFGSGSSGLWNFNEQTANASGAEKFGVGAKFYQSICPGYFVSFTGIRFYPFARYAPCAARFAFVPYFPLLLSVSGHIF